MANTIALITKYAPFIDEVYASEALTSDLDSDMSLTKAGANANEIAIPKITLQGLANYSRSTGYVARDNTLEYETVKFNYDRGGKFMLDAMDDEETAGIMYAKLSSELERTKAAPELDAFRFAKYASLAGFKPAGATLADGAAVLTAIMTANSAQDEAEVSPEGRILYITPTLYNMVKAIDTTKSREALDSFAKIKKVPQARFYSVVDLLDGTSADQEIGGYIKNVASGKDINFMIIDPKAVLQYTKHKVSGTTNPDSNDDADAYLFKFRKYGLCDVYDNKVNGIYVHKKA